MGYLYLAIAIICEVIATTALQQSNGFTRPLPSTVTAIGYAVAFYFLALVLKTVPVGVAYAIWSGAGIVLITGIAWVFLGQKLDWPVLAGMGMIIGGVVVVNLFTKATPH